MCERENGLALHSLNYSQSSIFTGSISVDSNDRSTIVENEIKSVLSKYRHFSLSFFGQSSIKLFAHHVHCVGITRSLDII